MFRVEKKSHLSKARLGVLTTPRGLIKTPFFMPDATRGVIKNITTAEWQELGLPATVVNTFHLSLTPGLPLIKLAGGVHKFINWSGPLLSDSGGYQIFSLIHKNKNMGQICADKVIFKSPLNGAEKILTPETAIQIQFDLGVDMMVVLDNCLPHNYPPQKIIAAVEQTIAWAKRCRLEFNRQIKKRKLSEKNRPLLFGVVQGGTSVRLRKKCAEELIKIGFDGLGYGARPVDSQGKFLSQVMKKTAASIPENYLRFALGVGKPEDIVLAVKMGWDMFDCVIPTREGRHGRLYQYAGCHPDPALSKGRGMESRGKKTKMFSKNFYRIININNSAFTKKTEPINKFSKLPILRQSTFAFLHHLFKINDPLGQRLATLNNLEFYLDLMAQIRLNIEKGIF